MKIHDCVKKAESYLQALCSFAPDRRTGSAGNRAATDYFTRTLRPWGYVLDAAPFACLDHRSGKASLACGGSSFPVEISPYSPGCDVTAPLVPVRTPGELEKCRCTGKILLMHGDICAEPLMPKNFSFYNPDHHKKIYALLEDKRPAAIVTATGRNPDLVGALYPYPLIEDGDFDIPSVYCTAETGGQIASHAASLFRLRSDARRIPSRACNVIARKNPAAPTKIVICAHIDAKEGTPGASDDASGIVVLLLLAEMLEDYRGPMGIEIVSLNGEDNYSAGGQKDYLRRYGSALGTVVIAINIDDVGYRKGKTAYSFYECPEELQRKVRATFARYAGLMEGPQWYQGDHMLFAQKGTPAIAFTAERYRELMATVTHTLKDTPDLINCRKLVETARALRHLVKTF